MVVQIAFHIIQVQVFGGDKSANQPVTVSICAGIWDCKSTAAGCEGHENNR